MKTKVAQFAIIGLSALLVVGRAQTNTLPTSGNVGIGTTSPQGPLHVMGGYGAIRIDSNIGGNIYADVSFWNGATRTAGIRSHNAANSSFPNLLEIWSESGNVAFSGGKVGIGTATPGQTLDVAGSIRAGGRTRIEIERSISGTTGDTMAVGSFSNDGIGKNIRIYLKAHNGSVIDVHTYEINEVAYIGSTTQWLELPLSQNSVSYTGAAGYAVDVYRANINSTADALYVRIRVKRPIGAGTVQLVLDYDDDVTFNSLSTAGSTAVSFNASAAPSSGGIDGYYGALEWSFPVSNGQGWNNAGNTGLFVRNNGNVGIGTTHPSYKFDVGTNAGQSATAGAAGIIRNATDADAPPYTQARMFVYGGAGVDTGNWGYFGYGSDAVMRVVYAKTGSASGQLSFGTSSATDGTGAYVETMRITNAGSVGIGTTSPSHKLSVNGTVRAKEVIVDTGWADYVFTKGYRLTPLAEVEQHIERNGHLPGIPSSTEVAERGVSVGEMQQLLLQKIEELTLHQIEQEKRLVAQQAEIAGLKEQNTRFQQQLSGFNAQP